MALSPVFLQTSTPLSCKSGDTTLSEFELFVLGQDRIVGFNPSQRDYNVMLPLGTNEARVRTVSTDPQALVVVDVLIDGERFRYQWGNKGGSDLVVPLPPGSSTLQVWVRAPKGASGVYDLNVNIGIGIDFCVDQPVDCSASGECLTDGVCDPMCDPFDLENGLCDRCPGKDNPVADGTPCSDAGSCFDGVCEPGQVFACTEQGIHDAIAAGGGPHTFDCNGPTVVTTSGGIVIDTDVILDGEGNLTVESVYPYPQALFTVVPGVTSELVGLRVAQYPDPSVERHAIRNQGSLTLTDCIVEPGDFAIGRGAAIYSDGSLTLNGTALRGGRGGMGPCTGIRGTGSVTLVDSTVSDVGAPDGNAVCSSGSLLMIRSAVVDSDTVAAAITASGDATLVNSTVSGNTYTAGTNAIEFGGTLTLINSTVVFSGRGFWTIAGTGNLFSTNSIITGPRGGGGALSATCSGLNTFSGGGNIESPGDTCGLTDPSDLVNVTTAELNLGPLADNGGPTMTHALLPGSVAIDRIPPEMCVDADGEPLTTDQRGVARPQGGMCDAGAYESEQQEFACTEQGVRGAIALSGGPHTFDCDGPTVVTTLAEIVIDNDVSLDGEGNLTIDGNQNHRVLSVLPGVTAELVGTTVSGGLLDFEGAQGLGILNEGSLTIRDSVVENNGSRNLPYIQGGGIYSSGTLSVLNSIVRGNLIQGGNSSRVDENVAGIYSTGTATLIGSEVFGNGAVLSATCGIHSTGTLTLIDTEVLAGACENAVMRSVGGPLNIINSTVNSGRGWGAIWSTGIATVISSTIGNSGSAATISHAGNFTLIGSTVWGGSHPTTLAGGSFFVSNSIVSSSRVALYCAKVTSGGGNIESPGDTCYFSDPTDLVNVTAEELNLGPLADNGGPTRTHALLPGSVAIDRIPPAMCVDADGQPLMTDQRGEPRPGGTMCDVGAFEVQP